MSGVFQGKGLIVPKGVCVRLGERGEMAACFDPETLTYKALWRGGFVKFSPTRHGFLDGLIMDGTPLPRPEGKAPERPFKYHGYYRHGKRIVFAYRIGETEMLDSPWVEDGTFTRTVGPAEGHPLAASTRGGPSQWPQVLETRGKRGETRPYAVDTIEPPFRNPWNAPMFLSDHDFFPDGTAMICTMQGDVWRVEGLDDDLASVRWRRFASGLHQALGLVIADGRVHVMGRDQLTRLHDLDGDGEADFYECVNNAIETSPGGHDFVCGLQRDGAGNFYTASGNQGLLKLAADGRKAEVVATGFRNPAGLGLSPEGVLTVPCSEGEWTPASMICEVRPGGFYGYRGPKGGQPPDLPLVYLPRGLDNSSGGQTFVNSDRWGPLKGQMIHFSSGTGTSFLVLRELVDGQPQGAVVPLETEFLSGVRAGGSTRRMASFTCPGCGGGTPSPSPTAASIACAIRATPCSSRSRTTPTRTASSSRSPGRSIAPWPRRRRATSPRRGTIATARVMDHPSSLRATPASPDTTRSRSGPPPSSATAVRSSSKSPTCNPSTSSTCTSGSTTALRKNSSPRSTSSRPPSPASPGIARPPRRSPPTRS